MAPKERRLVAVARSMSGYTVCVECFADDFLRELVRADGSPSGDDECEFCGAIGEPRIAAEMLAEPFENVARALFRSDQEREFIAQIGCGDSLGDLFRDLGALNDNVDDPDALVRAVLETRWTNVHQDDDHPDLDSSWIRAEDDWVADNYTTALQTLEAEVLQLGHSLHLGPGKRVAVDGPITAHAHDLIKSALEATEIVLEPKRTLYRARLDLETGQRTLDEFLPPPARFARAGRANLQGERVWYLAAEEDTARAEVRPSLASDVSVAEFVTRGKLRLCGLARRLIETSPFEDVEKYAKDRALADVANGMGMRFATPIRPSDTTSEYLFTQFLARLIREDGFDGIAYPSSQAPEGLNYVLFDPMLAMDFGRVRTVRCKRVTYAWGDEPPVPRARVIRDEDEDIDDDESYDDD